MNNIDLLMNQAKKMENFSCRESNVQDSEIEKLESTYSIVLPEDYCYFLKKYGATSWFGQLVPGLPGDNDKLKKHKNIFTLNENYRKDYETRDNFESVPKNGLIVNWYDGGGYYFLYCKNHEREGQVAWHIDENWGSENAYWNSFTDFLSYLVTDKPDADSGY